MGGSFSVADALAAARAETGRGLQVDYHSVTYGFWLGIAVVALIWATLKIWRTSRALDRLQQDQVVPQNRSASSRTVAGLTGSVAAR